MAPEVIACLGGSHSRQPSKDFCYRVAAEPEELGGHMFGEMIMKILLQSLLGCVNHVRRSRPAETCLPPTLY